MDRGKIFNKGYSRKKPTRNMANSLSEKGPIEPTTRAASGDKRGRILHSLNIGHGEADYGKGETSVASRRKGDQKIPRQLLAEPPENYRRLYDGEVLVTDGFKQEVSCCGTGNPSANSIKRHNVASKKSGGSRRKTKK